VKETANDKSELYRKKSEEEKVYNQSSRRAAQFIYRDAGPSFFSI
jgi:hypothetical protein